MCIFLEIKFKVDTQIVSFYGGKPGNREKNTRNNTKPKTERKLFLQTKKRRSRTVYESSNANEKVKLTRARIKTLIMIEPWCSEVSLFLYSLYADATIVVR